MHGVSQSAPAITGARYVLWNYILAQANSDRGNVPFVVSDAASHGRSPVFDGVAYYYTLKSKNRQY